MHGYTLRTQTTVRVSLLVAALLVTFFALGCTDSVPTALEDHETSTASVAAITSRAKPATTGAMRATFPQSVCGINVTTEYFSAGANWDPAPGGPPSKATGSLKLTWIAANGKSVQLQGAGQVTRDVTEWVNEHTFWGATTIIGRSESLKISHGPVLLNNAGKIVLGELVQLQPGGGVSVLEVVVLEINGPHPSFENRGLFCEIVRDTLT